ncbi:LOW QUALITY PROTEIN: zinc finger CCCH domain-containing protein 37-like [Tripterygium wilfordii]|uniref:LOW QUALITY PROTEIN: zinc finger CCCH domain-containing protein 37-like n=1 Tax=Tripterygium wilfordii TaxID=458696 RepID=UPI0018F85DCE|nr:LOW QUALITY PROTEIN: zinc finger CCCH domain-containing protein 37-like [Tripterygium wilfordii]
MGLLGRSPTQGFQLSRVAGQLSTATDPSTEAAAAPHPSTVYSSDSTLTHYLSASKSFTLDHPAYSPMYPDRVPGGIPPAAAPTTSNLPSYSSWNSTLDVESFVSGLKRSSDVLYHQAIMGLGAHNSIGQSGAWYSTDSLAKRSRFESASYLPVYPQRPGEKDCVHYMQTRTCKFGDTCIFDHPTWVPEGGIPDWKEVPLIATSALPERPGEPDCPYFMKTQRCKYGLRCRFNHPQDNLANTGASEFADGSPLPERPSEPPCAFYMKTGDCKFGATCKFHHPKGVLVQSSGYDNGNTQPSESLLKTEATMGYINLAKPAAHFTPALFHNSKGLPVRPGELDCPFYLKTGSCKYGTTCRYNHPAAAAIGHSIVASPATSLNIGVTNPAVSMYQTVDPTFSQATVGVGLTIYPQRPGQMECDYYMKTGECKFGERCRFHHPINRSAPASSMKLTLAGLPRREV